MAQSSAVASGDLATATQYNNLRDDSISTTLGHVHDGTNGRVHGDAVDLVFGAGSDAVMRWSTGDVSNHALVIGLGDSNQGLHITDKAAVATDWNVSADTHPTVYIHSNTTPATDYLRLGGHDGTTADVDVVGGTTLRLMIAGAVQATVTAAILNLPSGNTYQINATDVLSATSLGSGVTASSLTSLGDKVFINDTANAGMTVGLTINQGANDDEILAFKSSDVGHGLTSRAETDTYASMRKYNGDRGGLILRVIMETGETNPYVTEVYSGNNAQTQKSAANGRSIEEHHIYQHDGSNGLNDITANGNVFGIRAYKSGAMSTVFMVDEDGDLFAGNATVTVLTDDYNDAHLMRAFAYESQRLGGRGLVRSRWDSFVKYNRADLAEVGILGCDADDALFNVTQTLRVVGLATWQAWTERQEIKERIHTLESRLMALEAA